MKSIWIISDGKPGHLNQSRGLADALKRYFPDVLVQELDVLSRWAAIKAYVSSYYPLGEGIPELVIGAGHRTHLSVLAAGRATGAKTVVLMKPSLPQSWFDLCIVPEHDGLPASANRLVTKGALNRMRPAAKLANSGMLLIGGPSKHHGFEGEQLKRQILEIVNKDPQVEWLMTDSRRTPAGFLDDPAFHKPINLTCMSVDDTPPGWLAQQLPQRELCWVTADSVSMVYESLSAGCATGVLPMPQQGESRISRGLDALIREETVCSFAHWQQGNKPVQSSLAEAQRCAKEIIHRWFK